jgi:hypothetical protein
MNMGIFGRDFKGQIFAKLRGTALHIWRFIFSSADGPPQACLA